MSSIYHHVQLYSPLVTDLRDLAEMRATKLLTAWAKDFCKRADWPEKELVAALAANSPKFLGQPLYQSYAWKDAYLANADLLKAISEEIEVREID